MSATAKLAGKLPGNARINGIDPIASGLCARWDAADPDNPAAVLVVGILRVRKYENVTDEDGNRRKIPTLELSRIEQLGMLGRTEMEILDADGHCVQIVPVAPKEVHRLLLNAEQARTGDTPLPIDAESVDDASITIIGEEPSGEAQIVALPTGSGKGKR